MFAGVSEIVVTVLGTGVAAGIVTFLLNLVLELKKRQAESRRESLLLSNDLVEIVLQCENILGSHFDAAQVVDFEDVPLPDLPRERLVRLTERYQSLHPRLLSRLLDIDLALIEISWEGERAEFERSHIVDNDFDAVAHRVQQIRTLLRETTLLARELRLKAGGKTKFLDDILEGNSWRGGTAS